MFKRKFLDGITHCANYLAVELPKSIFKTIKKTIFGKPKRIINYRSDLQTLDRSNYLAKKMGIKRLRICYDEEVSSQQDAASSFLGADAHLPGAINGKTNQWTDTSQTIPIVHQALPDPPKTRGASTDEDEATITAGSSSTHLLQLDQPATVRQEAKIILGNPTDEGPDTHNPPPRFCIAVQPATDILPCPSPLEAQIQELKAANARLNEQLAEQKQREEETERLLRRYNILAEDHSNLTAGVDILKAFLLRVGQEANLSQFELEEEDSSLCTTTLSPQAFHRWLTIHRT
ncbi:hypothetical protein BC833DRAFT_626102 [Globomyces pollinis-pini]|nr:hypothetical protein BC833DRAFT_626102 [Globomyces pollinis-pini]